MQASDFSKNIGANVKNCSVFFSTPSLKQGIKGKAFPLQAWTGPWGSRRLRLQNF
jgi:hypothetical protein